MVKCLKKWLLRKKWLKVTKTQNSDLSLKWLNGRPAFWITIELLTGFWTGDRIQFTANHIEYNLNVGKTQKRTMRQALLVTSGKNFSCCVSWTKSHTSSAPGSFQKYTENNSEEKLSKNIGT